jgi:hypothetical protein
MPEGIVIKGCHAVSSNAGMPAQEQVRYRIVFPDGGFDRAVLDAFRRAEKWTWAETDRRGRLKSYELRRMVSSVTAMAPNTLDVRIENRPGKTLRPDTWVRGVFQLSDEKLKKLRIIKLDEGSDDV